MQKVVSLSLLVIPMLMASNSWALRIIEQTEESYELSLHDIVMPRSVGGSISFKPCEDCKTQSLRVSSATRYFVNRVELAFADFLRAVESIGQTNGGNAETAVYVHYDFDSRRVNRLRLSQP